MIGKAKDDTHCLLEDTDSVWTDGANMQRVHRTLFADEDEDYHHDDEENHNDDCHADIVIDHA